MIDKSSKENVDSVGYRMVGSIGKYDIYVKSESIKCKWIARNSVTGDEFPITYDQAMGRELIRPTEDEKMSKHLSEYIGRILFRE